MTGPPRVAATALLLALAAAPVRGAGLAELVERRAAGSSSLPPAARREAEDLRALYARRGFAPAWTDGRGSAPAAEGLLELFEEAANQGLEPEDYHPAELRARLSAARATPARSGAWLELDLELSRAALAYGHDLALGRIRPDEAGIRWLLEPRKVDVAERLARGLARAEPVAALRRLAPEHPEYALLSSALARLRAGQTPPALAPKDTAPELLAARLVLNLERWRWMPDRLGATHARVNLPAFELQLVEDGAEVLTSRVIVGRPDWETPSFTDTLERVMVNPYWNVPDPIARHELLPKLRRDPGLLSRRGYSVLDGWRADAALVDARRIDWSRVDAAAFPYRLRQEPGPGNALGRLIFLLGNDFEIYLHDTPGKNLFERCDRALSHGCIRVEGSRALAGRLFEREGRAAELAAAVASGRNGELELREPIPLHVIHFTVEPQGAGLRVHPDLYGVDARLAAALAERRRAAFSGW